VKNSTGCSPYVGTNFSICSPSLTTVSACFPSVESATYVLASPQKLGRNILTPPMIKMVLWSSSFMIEFFNFSSSSFTCLTILCEISSEWGISSASSSYVNILWHEISTELISSPFLTYKIGMSPLPTWQLTISTDPFPFPTWKPTEPLPYLFSSSLRFSAYLNHIFNTCFFPLDNNFQTCHLFVLFKFDSYLHRTFSFCCILNAIFSIWSWISLISFSISSFLFYGKTLPWPCSWLPTSILIHLHPTWLFNICCTHCNNFNRASHSVPLSYTN